MGWKAHLAIDYRLQNGTTVAHHRHTGPLRILQSLYPEGPHLCHNIMVHPPAGLVGGDTLDIDIHVAQGAHGLLTTPGATRFYRSDTDVARQHTVLTVAPEARLEWLPQETICYNECKAENHLEVHLHASSEFIGWDITALGLPHANQPFVNGHLLQHLELPGRWIERGIVDASDQRLMNGPTGLGGQRCMASLIFASGTAPSRARKEMALEIARSVMQTHSLQRFCGVTSPRPGIIIVRALAPVVEPVMDLLQQIRNHWRSALWNIGASNPRIWSM